MESKPVSECEPAEGLNGDIEFKERIHGWDSNTLKLGLRGGSPEESLERRRKPSKTNEVDKVWLDEEDIRRPQWWKEWEKREQQRPTPLEPPRAPDMEYCDQTQG